MSSRAYLSVFSKISKVFWKLQNNSRDVLKFKNEKILIFQCLKNCYVNLSIFIINIERLSPAIVKVIEKAIRW